MTDISQPRVVRCLGALALVLVGVVLLIPKRSIPEAVDTRAALACSNLSRLTEWSTPRLVEQTVVIPVDEDELSSIAPEVASGAGGIILFGSTVPPTFASQLTRLSDRAPQRIAPLVMADEEGGSVQRLANAVGEVDSPREMGLTMSPSSIESLARGLGERMLRLGVNTDLAPVADVDGGAGPNARDPDGTRSFSASVSVASADASAFMEGLSKAGVLSVVKHFPGLGGASGNTDVTAATTPAWPVEKTRGLAPFVKAISKGAKAIMISNAVVPGLSRVPAGISPVVVTKLLRTELHFDGLVLTDSLSAVAIQAVGLSVPAASVDALRAGDDMVLFNAISSDVASTTSAIVNRATKAVALHELTRARLIEAVSHILTAKKVDLCAS